jgi:lactose/L-arabinose transport system ATP-binding protein
MAKIQLDNVKKSYGAHDVIHGVDLEINDKEFVVFVGPSGCGKSTLLRMVAGLESVNSGSIHIGDRDVTDLQPVDRNIAMVFQSYALYPHMTVRENMGFALKANGMDAAEVNERVNSAASSLQLSEYLDRKPKALSGGQRQRVAIGRAIVRNPEVFLFDEPLSNLDAELRVHMRLEIAKLHERLGATMIYVTHDQVEAMTLADKIVVLKSGKIMQVGSPLELFDDPDNQFVAGFIGSPKMNFLKGSVVDRSQGTATVELVEHEQAKIEVTVAEPTLAVGHSVTIGIRPEHFSLKKVVGGKITITCDAAEHLGETTYVYATNSEGSEIAVELRNDRSAKGGDKINVFLPSEKTFVFSKDGRRLR